MPIPSNISGTPILGFSSPSNFFVGWSPSNLYPLRGLGWSMNETPAFSTLEADTPSGRDVRVPQYINPLHSWKLTFNFLENDPALDITGNPDTDLRILYSFYTAQTGKFAEFLYQPRESSVAGQPLSLPDANGYVELVYSLGPFFAESVQELNGALPTILLNDADITSHCTFYAAGSVAPYSGIVFTIGPLSPPVTFGPGDVLTADYTFFYRCHFSDDKLTFEEFIYRVMKTGIGIEQARI